MPNWNKIAGGIAGGIKGGMDGIQWGLELEERKKRLQMQQEELQMQKDQMEQEKTKTAINQIDKFTGDVAAVAMNSPETVSTFVRTRFPAMKSFFDHASAGKADGMLYAVLTNPDKAQQAKDIGQFGNDMANYKAQVLDLAQASWNQNKTFTPTREQQSILNTYTNWMGSQVSVNVAKQFSDKNNAVQKTADDAEILKARKRGNNAAEAFRRKTGEYPDESATFENTSNTQLTQTPEGWSRQPKPVTGGAAERAANKKITDAMNTLKQYKKTFESAYTAVDKKISSLPGPIAKAFRAARDSGVMPEGFANNKLAKAAMPEVAALFSQRQVIGTQYARLFDTGNIPDDMIKRYTEQVLPALLMNKKSSEKVFQEMEALGQAAAAGDQAAWDQLAQQILTQAGVTGQGPALAAEPTPNPFANTSTADLEKRRQELLNR